MDRRNFLKGLGIAAPLTIAAVHSASGKPAKAETKELNEEWDIRFVKETGLSGGHVGLYSHTDSTRFGYYLASNRFTPGMEFRFDVTKANSWVEQERLMLAARKELIDSLQKPGQAPTVLTIHIN